MSDIPDRIHRTLIERIVKGLSDKPLILKGGTALMLAYNLDRYSEDIDYDSDTKIDLAKHLESIMQKTRMQYEIVTKKQTDTTSRVSVKYTTGKAKGILLKIEVKNNRQISSDDISNHPGFLVYTVNKICEQKLHASSERIKARDFYDLGFIAGHYKDALDNRNLIGLKELANNKTIHELYQEEWHEDEFVRDRPISATIKALNSIMPHIQDKDKESEYDLELLNRPGFA